VEELKILIQIPMRVVVYPSAENPKIWIAHALDIMGHGSSQKAALSMLNEAMAETVLFRLTHNLPPVEIAPAPPEVWKLAHKAGLAKRSIPWCPETRRGDSYMKSPGKTGLSPRRRAL
jgi:hypothetical protein